ncbi:hypothetical protein D3C78_301440 [compost metagenome]
MLVIRQNGRGRVRLERKVSSSGAHGIWEFHCAENSQMFQGLQAGRHAALVPAEPKEGQEVEVHLMLHANSPQEEWKPIGKGVAHYL